jgi:hypothetical protein
MTAGVEKSVDVAPRVADNQYRVFANIGGYEIARVRYLRFVA